MNQKVFRYIIFLMAISFLGIISFQAYWIWLKVNEKAAVFDQNVYRSLAQIRNELDEKEAFIFIKRIQSSSSSIQPIKSYLKGQEEINDFTEIIFSDGNEFSFEVKIDTVESKNYQSNEEILEISKSHLENIVLKGSNINVKYNDKANGRKKKEADLVKIYTQKKNNLETAIQKMAVDFTLKHESLQLRLNNINLDSTISEKLKSEGILTTEYNYFIKDNETDSIIINSNTSNIIGDKNTFSTKILENTESNSGGTLGISFQNKTKFILKSIWLTLLISVLLTLIMIFTFSYTIHSILKEKKLSRIKADFINNMTHEFKTPIATISLAIDSMLHPLVRKDQNEIEKFGMIIKKENQRMNHQIESVLNAARFEKENIDLKIEQLNVHEILKELIEDFTLKSQAQSGDIKLNLTTSDIFVLGDEMHFYNAIRNLIDNGIKFSKEAFRINIKTQFKNDQLLLEIADKGIGMDKETQNHAFDRFYRKSEGNIHTTKGFGLGLSYVNEIITRMNGKISIDSSLGKGTKVIIEIPITS